LAAVAWTAAFPKSGRSNGESFLNDWQAALGQKHM